MKITEAIMGMPITIEIVDSRATEDDIGRVFDYFTYIDNTFSTWKEESEISLINKGILPREKWSRDMKTVFDLCDKTRMETRGYFDISHNGKYDPSGLVKGWAIRNAAGILERNGFRDYYVEAGGDVQAHGSNREGAGWKAGIRNPFNRTQIVKAVLLKDQGIATSGTYIRGQHVYNPFAPDKKLTEIVSLTVIGPDVYEADRFATAAFAMERNGIAFIENIPGFEGYMIDRDGVATYTSGFTSYLPLDGTH